MWAVLSSEKSRSPATNQDVVDGLTGSIGMLAGLGATPEEREVEERKESPSGREEKDEKKIGFEASFASHGVIWIYTRFVALAGDLDFSEDKTADN